MQRMRWFWLRVDTEMSFISPPMISVYVLSVTPIRMETILSFPISSCVQTRALSRGRDPILPEP